MGVRKGKGQVRCCPSRLQRAWTADSRWRAQARQLGVCVGEGGGGGSHAPTCLSTCEHVCFPRSPHLWLSVLGRQVACASTAWGR